MKKLLVIAAMTAAATTAFAGVKLEVRSDYANTFNYDDALGNTGGGTSLFTPAVARLYLSGNVGDAVIDSGWNLRAFTPFEDANGQIQHGMNVDSFVDYLTIAKSVDGWTFAAGKLNLDVGGWEHQQERHGDTYLVSLANGGFGGKASQGIRYGSHGTVTTPSNASGISAAYTVMDQKFVAELSNQTNSQTANVTTGSYSIDKQNSYGISWMGEFANKMFQPTASYTIGAADTSTTGISQEFIAAGLRMTFIENLWFNVEYFANKAKYTGTGLKDDKTTSAIVEARYKFGMWTPGLKFESSENKAQDNENTAPSATTTGSFKRTAAAIDVELVPKAEDNFRYHLAFQTVKDDYGLAALKDVTQNQIVIGFKYMGDIAK
jgi:hypothetical protein